MQCTDSTISRRRGPSFAGLCLTPRSSTPFASLPEVCRRLRKELKSLEEALQEAFPSTSMAGPPWSYQSQEYKREAQKPQQLSEAGSDGSRATIHYGDGGHRRSDSTRVTVKHQLDKREPVAYPKPMSVETVRRGSLTPEFGSPQVVASN